MPTQILLTCRVTYNTGAVYMIFYVRHNMLKSYSPFKQTSIWLAVWKVWEGIRKKPALIKWDLCSNTVAQTHFIIKKISKILFVNMRRYLGHKYSEIMEYESPSKSSHSPKPGTHWAPYPQHLFYRPLQSVHIKYVSSIDLYFSFSRFVCLCVFVCARCSF